MVILSVDLDAFYCTVEQKYDPSLDKTPFIVYQKDCIATLSYAARALGLCKLGSVAQAVKRFPEIRVINGENLAKYRHEGKLLFQFVHNLVGVPVERLGLEELRFDISDIVDYNVRQLQMRGLLDFDKNQVEDDEEGVWLNVSTDEKFFCEDFFFDIEAAKLYPPSHGTFLYDFKNYIDHYIGGHIAVYIQEKITAECKLSCSIGVANNITLAKMICSYNKPNGVSVLIPSYSQQFLNPKPIASIPGFGSSTVLNISRSLPAKSQAESSNQYESHQSIADDVVGDGAGVSEKRRNPAVDSLSVCQVLDHFSRGEFCQLPIFKPDYLWGLLHGIDNSSIQDTPLYPNQISIENSYSVKGLSFANARFELNKLCISLLKQLYTDMIDTYTKSWIAYPTSFRLAIRHTGQLMAPYPSRRSKSAPVYSYVYNLCNSNEIDCVDFEAMAECIVKDTIYPMLEELWKPVASKELIKLLNVAATNMVETMPCAKHPAGRKEALYKFF